MIRKLSIILICLGLLLAATSGWGMSKKKRLMVIGIATGSGPSGPALLNENSSRLLNEDGTYLLQE